MRDHVNEWRDGQIAMRGGSSETEVKAFTIRPSGPLASAPITSVTPVAKVYAGALFVESYGLSTQQTGLLLGLAALAHFPGMLLARRHVEQHARSLLILFGLTAAAGTALLGLVRPSPAASLVLFATCKAAIGGRRIAGSAFGLGAAPDQRVAVMGLRAAAVQFGYLLGAASGGAAVAVGGYDLLGATLGILCLLGVAPHLRPLARLGPPPRGRDSRLGATDDMTPCASGCRRRVGWRLRRVGGGALPDTSPKLEDDREQPGSDGSVLEPLQRHGIRRTASTKHAARQQGRASAAPDYPAVGSRRLTAPRGTRPMRYSCAWRTMLKLELPIPRPTQRAAPVL
jgi:Major Facilitator Superfamily